MKRSQIFLGATSFVLAIAGVIATKANTRAFTTYYVQTSAPSQFCTAVSNLDPQCTLTPKSVICTTGGSDNLKLYVNTTGGGNHTCGTPLWKLNS